MQRRKTGWLLRRYRKTGPLQLEVPDATRVLMRNSPSEFSCGPQQARPVKVEYAKATGKRGPLLRGMEFQ